MPHARNVTTGFTICGAIVTSISLVLNIFFISMAPVAIKTGQELATDMINNEIPALLERELDRLAPRIFATASSPEAQNALVGAALSILEATQQPSPESTPALPHLADELQPRQQQQQQRRCEATSSAQQCRLMLNTCSSFETCRTQRTLETCTAFATETSALCSGLDCRKFNPERREICGWVKNACDYRFACLMNPELCISYEDSVQRACSELGIQVVDN